MATSTRAPRTTEKAASQRPAWRREAGDLDYNERLGVKLRSLRETRGLSLRDASELTGVPAPTLSRIEANKMAPTFAVIARITAGLGFEISEFAMDDILDTKRISISRSAKSVEIPGVTYRRIHTSSALGRFLGPIIMDITATSASQMGGLVAHKGIEFCYVLEGSIRLQFEGRRAETLRVGESALFDARVPHAYVVSRGKTARVLNVQAMGGQADLMGDVTGLRSSVPPDVAPRRRTPTARTGP